MIPKKIYITHSSLDCLKQPKEKWESLNPDWTVELFDNEMCCSFLEKEFGSLYKEIFCWIPDGPIQCDFWRVCILYKRGGLYVDADIEPIESLKNFIESKASLGTCISYLKGYNPHFLFAQQGEALLKTCIDTYISYYRTKRPYEYWDWSITKIFTIPYFSKKTQSGVYIWNGQYVQLLKEETGNTRSDMFCSYKGKKVFNNRFLNYDYENHRFLEIPKPSDT